MRTPCLLVLFMAASVHASAQNTGTATQKKVYQTTLGGVSGSNIQSERLKTMLDSALAVRDERRKTYPVTGFRVSYFFDSRYEDEETGRTVSKRALRVRDFFDSDRLDADWIASIRDNVKIGDELLFDKILIRLPNGKKTLAPDLRYKVE